MNNKLVLVLNCGSSSLKFAVINADNGGEIMSGLAECFNLPEARIKWKMAGTKKSTSLPPYSAHSAAISFIVEEIIKKEAGLTEQFVAVGHRIVHGGERFTESVIIDDHVLEGIEQCSSLAPLHNPAHALGIRAAQVAFPALPQVAVFDTAFHQTMPAKAFMYALPYHLYKEYSIRRYGMHGTSNLFVTHEAAKILNKPVDDLNVICAHLGNGASVTAIKKGQSVDTSMGLTPLDGLVMGTRCGDLDPSIIEYLITRLGYSIEGVMEILQKQSGLLGISGISSDFREIIAGYEQGSKRATLAIDMFIYRLAKYIASYAVPLGHIDAIIFTGGIGENSPLVRSKVLELLTIFGYQVDGEKNKAAILGNQGIITIAGSPIAMVIPTNEEWVIAQDSAKLVSNQSLSL
ncbi:acetate kinase [Psychromonas ingrahamii 37]|uniref:Acetate kinase n=1 Tax=Psychromonas ingrahamii (strain DSM 17664 / CCUG 51855 / 37) TaxID=357804 RepID=A1SZT3_PSYIN|nr:acetate kinase [Psychromonas ingrahamii]ABM04998.1 acetate kinase [Psychromonas ingrahamii 37]